MGKGGRSAVFLDREYIDQKFADLKAEIISYMDLKFRALQNRQDQISGMIMPDAENEIPKPVGKAADPPPEYAWKLDVRRRVDKLVKEYPEIYPDFNSVLRRIYRRMRDVYGFVSEQAIKEYKRKYRVDKASCLEVISEDESLRSLFEPILANYEEECRVEHERRRAAAEALAGKSQKEIIAPLITARNDRTNYGCATYTCVQSRMKRNGVDFAAYEEKYRKKTGLSRKIKNNELIENVPELKKKFAEAVAEMMLEVERENAG